MLISLCRPAMLIALSVMVVGCASRPPLSTDSPGFRRPGPRGLETIFSPIDLPTPTSIRTASGLPGPDYWQQRADYDIEATLDAEARMVRGAARIVYTNHSPHALDYLWLHLEQNLFRIESEGALITPPGGSARFGNRDAFAGGFEIESLRLDGNDLAYRVYDTLARVDLPRPVGADGGQVAFEIAWSFKLPGYGSDRMGTEDVEQGTIFQIAQWFPAVAVYDDVYGWNILPYLGQGEFYTDFGNYDVRLTVPRTHLVAATGALQNPRDVLTPEQAARLERARGSAETILIVGPDEVGTPGSRPAGDGPLTWEFRARDVRTFAWTSSAAFIWDAAGIAERGPTPGEAGGEPGDMPSGTLVQSVYPKEALPLWSQSTDMLRFAIEGYNERWFKYPYPSATNVNGIVGGMEYPMIIFCRERAEERGLYGVTTHEIGHNWFPMVVSNDERRHAWMDEGFNTFINYYSNRERYADKTGGRGDAREFAPQMLHPDQQAIETGADQIVRGRLGTLAYAKTAAGLVLLREQILGPDRFDFAFRRYIHRWAFKSPRPADFFRCMEDASGMDLAWFWRGWFLETGTLDQSVESMRQDEERKEARVTFATRGELVMPVVYRVTYADGAQETRRLPVQAWFTSNTWETAWPTGGRRVVEVLIDPEEAFPDVDPSNNRWKR